MLFEMPDTPLEIVCSGLGKDCDVQVPRAVHVGSQVSVAAASGVCTAILVVPAN